MSVVGADALKHIITKFPGQISYAFAYGSAVFQQQNQKVGKMVDLVFAVDDPLKWHTENLKMNSSHYSFIKHLGPKYITKVQETWASGVYYNPYVTVEGQLLKYGVVSTKTLNDDLYNWKHIYLAGRLHKPVLELKEANNFRTQQLILRNHKSALSAALLLLPRYTTKFQLYRTITELSYIGDFRMSVGENPEKVANIVSAMMTEFDKIYLPLIELHKPYIVIDKIDRLIQETLPKARFSHLMMLPHPLQRALTRIVYPEGLTVPVEEVLAELSRDRQRGEMLRKCIAQITWGSSIRQTLQGIVTAGPTKSIMYGYEKLKKKATASSEAKTNLPAKPPPFKEHRTRPLTYDDFQDMNIYQKLFKKVHLSKKKPMPQDPLLASMVPNAPPSTDKKKPASRGFFLFRHPLRPADKP